MLNRKVIALAVASAVFAVAPVSRADLLVPQFSSLPSASKTLFLDFDGGFTASFGPYSNIVTPAYDIDLNPVDFSLQEKANIQKIWSGVAEKYSPFNLNVTTIDPGDRSTGVTMTVNIGGDSAWYGPVVGGVSSIGGFLSGYTTAFAFSKNLGNGNVKYVAEAAAHEAGHAFNLQHQSTYDPVTGGKIQEYNDNGGSGPNDRTDKAPIMGLSYYADRGIWWRGPSSISRIVLQDDLSKLSALGSFANNFGYRVDDVLTTAPLTPATDFAIEAAGIIENTTDTDTYAFHSPGGTMKILAGVNPDAPMLDLSLSLLDSDGNIVGASATASLGELLMLHNMPEDDYRIVIASAGLYGDIGQYFISGFVAPEPAGAALLFGGIWLACIRRRSAAKNRL